MVCGILCIAAGITVFVFPMDSYVTLGILFGVMMLVVGAAQLLVSFTSGNYFAMRGYLIAGGVLDLLMGIILCVNPGITMILMPILLGVWMLYHSFIVMAFGGDMDTMNVSGGGMVIVGGAFLMLLSAFVLVNPFSAGVAAVVVLAGLGLLVLGVLFMILAFKLRYIHRQFDPE